METIIDRLEQKHSEDVRRHIEHLHEVAERFTKKNIDWQVYCKAVANIEREIKQSIILRDSMRNIMKELVNGD